VTVKIKIKDFNEVYILGHIQVFVLQAISGKRIKFGLSLCLFIVNQN
jgi:hypothetical protein